MSAVKPRSPFGEKLRMALDSQPQGSPAKTVKGLARVLRPHDVEGMRRNLNRWISGPVSPAPENRRAVEQALGLATGSLDDDADDEESDPVQMFQALLGRLVDAAVSARLGAGT